MFTYLSHLINRLPWLVVATTLAFAVLAGFFGSSVASSLQVGGFQDPTSQSVQAGNRLQAVSKMRPDGGLIALVSTPTGANPPEAQVEAARVARLFATNDDVALVVTYDQTHDPSLIARDNSSTLVIAYWKPISDQAAVDATARLSTTLKDDPHVKLGGFAAVNYQLNSLITSDLTRAELIAFPILFLLSLWVFRSLVAALLPPLVGGVVILSSFLLLRTLTNFHPVSIFALNLATGMGLGLAIDYSLFMVSRFREELANGAPPDAAIATTLATAGRTVLFSSLTIAAAVGSLTVFPLNFLWSMGVAGVIVALAACIITLTLLPATLRLLGPRINSFAPRTWQRALSTPAPRSGFWYRFPAFVMRHPLPLAALSATLLIALGLPFASIRFNSVDFSSLPASADARVVNDTLIRSYGAAPGASVTLVLTAPNNAATGVQAFASSLSSLPHVTAITPPVLVGDSTWRFDVLTDGGNFDDNTQAFVRTLRTHATPFPFLVTGAPAAFVDLQASLASSLPLAIALVTLTTLFLLFLMTGSLILPIKAVIMNLLTLSAAFGLLVLVFQDGRFQDLLAYTSQGALESTQPVLLFAIVFGLSTDYGVFLLTRIKEAHDAGAPNKEAVALGLQRTGRIITAAALLFCVAVGVFATSEIIFLKELVLGVAAGVLLDATIVRAFLVPSLMALLGRWNWYSPRPLRWLYAHSGFGNAAVDHATASSPPPPRH